MNKYQALKHNDGRMLAVVWPEKSLYVIDDDGLERYQAACEQAITNGIEFKDLNDCEQIRKQLWKLETRNNDSRYFSATLDGWEMEPMKPYPLPEGLELEIRTDQCVSPCCDECQEHGCMRKNFAFIKHEPKEEVESQDELWDNLEGLISNDNDMGIIISNNTKSKFRIERIKK